LHDAIFLQVAMAWAKQEKKFLWLTFLPDTATQRQVIDFFHHHDLAKFYSPPYAKPQITWCRFLHAIVVRMQHETSDATTSHKKKNCFLTRLALIFLICQINSVWFLEFFAYFHAKVFQILRKSMHGRWMYWQGKL